VVCFHEPSTPRIHGDVDAAQSRLDQRFGFDLIDQRTVTGHRDADALSHRVRDEFRYARAQHRLPARKVDFGTAEFRQAGNDFVELFHLERGRSCLAPVVAHPAFEIASIN
jgi:hypothetical protein